MIKKILGQLTSNIAAIITLLLVFGFGLNSGYDIGAAHGTVVLEDLVCDEITP